MTTSRNNHIDIAKGLGILLVVAGHNWIVTHDGGLAFQMIYSFHMPLFFLLSGVFLSTPQTLPVFLRAKAESLLKPYVVVLTLLGIYKIAVGAAKPGQYFLGVLYGVGSTLNWTQLWFLPSLFVTLVFSWLLLNILRSERHPVIGLGTIITALFLLGAGTIQAYGDLSVTGQPFLSTALPNNTMLHGLPWSIDLLPVSAAFLLAGYLLRTKIQQTKFHPSHLLAAGAIFIVCHLALHLPTDLNTRVYGHWLLTPLRALLGIYITLSLSTLLARHRLAARPLAYLGQASLFILIFHAYVEWEVFNKLVWYVHASKYTLGAITFVGSVAVSLILFEISKRFAPLRWLLLPASRRPAPALPTAALPTIAAYPHGEMS